MKFPVWVASISFSLIVAPSGHSDSPDLQYAFTQPDHPAEISSSNNSPTPAKRLTREEFLENLFDRAYQNFGHKDPKWDETAESFLRKYADGAIYNKIQNPDQTPALIRQLEKSGCNDPLINYILLRRRYNTKAAIPEATNAWVLVTLDFDQTRYPEYWKFYSRLRAIESINAVVGHTNPPMVVEFSNDAAHRLISFLRDKSLPPIVMYEAVQPFIEDVYQIKNVFAQTFPEIERLIQAGWDDTREASVLIGRAHIQLAWNERGKGYADSVTSEGWAGFASHLKIAHAALEKSWNIKSLLALSALARLRRRNDRLWPPMHRQYQLDRRCPPHPF
jgi:hypothetical protein